MNIRIEACTDVAMIGAWDESQNQKTLDSLPYAELMSVLAKDAEQGCVFIIRTGGDGGGSIDVYVNEDIPRSERSRLRKIRGTYLICAPTGRIVVGGAEDYRSQTPRIISASSVVPVTPGNYALELFVAKDPEDTGLEPPSRAEVEAALGSSNYAYYRSIERRGLRGYLLLLIFPVLSPWLGWKLALLATSVPVAAYFWFHEQLLKKSSRYQLVLKEVNALWMAASNRGGCSFAISLRSLQQPERMKGGIVDLSGAAPGSGDKRKRRK